MCASGANEASQKVWFLVSDVKAENTATIRQCTIPTGKAVFFPIYNTECSTVEDEPFFLDLTAEAPEDCVEKFFDASFMFRTVRNLRVVIDGRPVRHLEHYLFQSELFDFTLPPEGDNFLEVEADACDNPNGCQAIAEGYWILVPPFSKGKHTIVIYGETWDEQMQPPTVRRYINTRYELTVKPGPKDH